MAYTPQQWHDDTTDSPYGPISGARLNYIEAGIQAAAAAADAAGTAGGGGSVTLGTAAPIIDGVAAAGSSGSASHEDHVHPTDTSRAALASPTFSGTPSLPTASVGVTQSAADSSTKLATTAFVTTADNLKANLAGPTFTGSPVLPTGTTGVTQTAADNSTKLSTTAYADAAAAARAPASGIAESAVTNLVSDLAAKAPLASPTFTGTATIPNIAGPTTLAGTVTLPSTTIAVTQSASDNSTKPATTAYVDTADALKSNLASPTFSGTPAAPTAAGSTNTTQLATTAMVQSAIPLSLTLPPDRAIANKTIFAWQDHGGQAPGLTALKPIFYPIDVGGIESLALSAVSMRVSTSTAATLGVAIYSVTYSAGPNISATLVCQNNATISGNNGPNVTQDDVTTGAAGSGASVATLNFVTTRYIIGIMASDVATLRCWGNSYAATFTTLGIRSWTAAARSSATDWPASFTQSSAVAISTGTPIIMLDLLTATGKLYA